MIFALEGQFVFSQTKKVPQNKKKKTKKKNLEDLRSAHNIVTVRGDEESGGRFSYSLVVACSLLCLYMWQLQSVSPSE